MATSGRYRSRFCIARPAEVEWQHPVATGSRFCIAHPAEVEWQHPVATASGSDTLAFNSKSAIATYSMLGFRTLLAVVDRKRFAATRNLNHHDKQVTDGAPQAF